MKTHDTTYLIVGGGMAADAAIRELCSHNPEANITLISAESTLPYDRPPLSKDLLTDSETTPSDIVHDPEPYSQQVTTFLGRKVEFLAPDAHSVRDSEGNTHTYKKLLLATGGSPRTLDGDSDLALYFRTLSDFKHVQQSIALEQRVAVIGGGFIGSEIAASLSETACDPFMIFPGDHIGAGRFPEDLGRRINETYRENGVDLLPGQRVTQIEKTADGLRLSTDGNGRYAADTAIAGLGIRPNTELAEQAGLTVDDGIRVNEHLQTSHPDIYAAGDVASAYRKSLDRYERVEHEMNAIEMGKAAGKAMAGKEVNFETLPLYYSDLFDDGFEAVGDLDTSLEVVEDWQDENKAVIYYLKNQHVRGVLCWNIFGKTDEARALMQDGGTIDAEDLPGHITAA